MPDRQIADTSQVKVTWRNIALFLITSGVLILCLRMALPFLPAIVGAIVLAVATHRPYVKLQRRVRNRTWAATIATAIVVLCIIVPALFLTQLLGQYTARVSSVLLQDGSLQKTLADSGNRYPQLAAIFRHGSELLALSNAAEKAAGFVATNLVRILSNSFAILTQLVITLFILFFLYRDEWLAIDYLKQLLPMSEGESLRLLSRIDETIRATVIGTFVVAAIQGVLSGLTFAVLGVGDAALLGVFVTVAAIIPYFGAYVVWLPVAIYLALTGHWIAAVILLIFGAVVISSLDNFLYPVLVGARMHQHPTTVLVSLLGGIWLFGLSGLILGPAIFAIADALLVMWRENPSTSSQVADPSA